MKKSFATSPALRFISSAARAVEDEDAQGIEAADASPPVAETKARRVQLLMQPSLFEAAKAKADEAGISFNEYVSRILRDALTPKGE